jgi:hypothetical protein
LHRHSDLGLHDARLVGNDASSDGKTAVTTTMQYTYRYHGIESNLIQSENYITYYTRITLRREQHGVRAP